MHIPTQGCRPSLALGYVNVQASSRPYFSCLNCFLALYNSFMRHETLDTIHCTLCMMQYAFYVIPATFDALRYVLYRDADLDVDICM